MLCVEQDHANTKMPGKKLAGHFGLLVEVAGVEPASEGA
jgi:hypothetical protein